MIVLMCSLMHCNAADGRNFFVDYSLCYHLVAENENNQVKYNNLKIALRYTIL